MSPAPAPAPESVALFDLDGTLADFDLAMRAGMAKLAGPGDPPWDSGMHKEDEEPEYITARRRLIKAQPGFWRDLPRLEDGFKILKMARELGYRPMILSRGPRRQCAAWSEKLEWCRKHLPDIAVTLTEDKGLVYGAVLVDDWPPYIERWLTWRQRGLVIMPSRKWNLEFNHPQVKHYVMGKTDKEIRQALQLRMKLHRTSSYGRSSEADALDHLSESDHKP